MVAVELLGGGEDIDRFRPEIVRPRLEVYSAPLVSLFAKADE